MGGLLAEVDRWSGGGSVKGDTIGHIRVRSLRLKGNAAVIF